MFLYYSHMIMYRPYSKIFVVLKLILAFCVSIAPLKAQEWTSGNRFMIHIGAGLPVGSFGQAYNLANDIETAFVQVQSGAAVPISTAERTEIGNATLGFTAGITDLYKITPNFSLLGTLELAYNPFNSNDYSNQFTALFRNPAFLQRLGINSSMSGINISLDAALAMSSRTYLNTVLLLGGRYDVFLNPSISLYGSAQAGLLYGIYPEIATDLKQTVTGLSTSPTLPISIRQTVELKSVMRSMSAFAFAYKVGLGMLFNDRINIGLAYLGSQPQYGPATQTVQGTLSSSVTLGTITMTSAPINTNLTREISTRTNLPVGLLQLTVGYLLGQ